MSQRPSDQASAAAADPCVEVAIAVVFAARTPTTADETLLICQRKADTVLPGYWEFPGGKCLPGEDPAACVIREVEEETGLHVKVLGALATIQHVYPHARVRLHPFVCQHIGGTLELRAVAEARWIAPAQVVDFRFPEANGPLLQQVRQGKAWLLQLSKAST